MPNVEFIARNGIVSRGNLVVSGSVTSTSPASFSGSLSLTGDLNFQPGASGATRFISMSALPTTASGNSIVIQAGNATGAGTGGGIQLLPGFGAGGPGSGTVTISSAGSWQGATVNGVLTVTNSGPNTGTSLALNGGGAVAMRWDWDNPNFTISAVTSAARILRFVGAAQYQVRGSGTTSSTTAFLVQNANASSSLAVLDNGNVGIGVTTPTAKLHIAAPGSSNYILKAPAENGNPGFEIYRPADNSTKLQWYGSGGTVIGSLDDVYGTGISMGGNWSTNGVFSIQAQLSVVPFELYTPYYGGLTTLPVIRIRDKSNNVLGSTMIELRQNGGAFFSGSVGIGTSTPSASLHISGSSNSALFEIDSPTANNIIFVSGSGNVGIGTGTPTATLHIAHSSSAIIRLQNVGGSSANFAIAAGNSRLELSGDASGARLTLFQSAKFVGINQQTPTAALHIVGSGATSSTTGLLVQNSNGSSSLQVLDNGNVGIGGDAMAASYKLRVYGSIWADGFDQLSALNGNAGVGKIQYYDDGATLLMRVYGPHPSEAVKGILTLDRQDLEYTTLANSITHTASFFMDHPSFVIRSNNTSANSFFLQNYMYASGALFVTNQPAGGDTSFRFRPSASLVGSTDVFVINTSGAQVTGNLSVTSPASTGSALYAYKSGSTVLDIQGSQGQLFSVIDALSGSLMSVNDISGLPIVEVFSDDRVVMGTYGAPAVIISGSNTVISGSLRGRVVTLSTASATASMDCSLSNFFSLTLSGSSTLFLSASNIQPGQTVNLRVIQPATSGSLTYGSQFKFAGGIPYSASASGSAVDLISFISYDTAILYGSAIKNLS